ETEKIYFEQHYGQGKTVFLPLFFQSEEKNEPMPAVESYILYHGDLSTPENRNAALFLMQQLAPLDANITWMIAGKNPHPNLLKEAIKHPNVNIRANLTEAEMHKMIQEAAVNFLYTNQISGVKLKLLNALHFGGHCIANAAMLAGSGLENLCRIMPDNPQQIISLIRDCFSHPLTAAELHERQEKMKLIYDNRKNVEILIRFLISN
ncbi:MAG: glycosyltransferase, partial [Dysgonamonadaceae bacterium]|nr:glycosyltransferase [Dysgonamonadaceae bacterium]